jgi:poly(A) polymerase
MDEALRPLEIERKAPLTAVVLIPPEEVWGPIQAIRDVHDPQFFRWMPHVTLLYPFVPERRLADAAELLRPAAASVEPFEVTLQGFGHFTHESGTGTAWVTPHPVSAMAELQSALQRAMPWCDDVIMFSGGFTPHLSVGRFHSRGDAVRMTIRLDATWEPIRFMAKELALIARSGAPNDPFHVRITLPLGSR